MDDLVVDHLELLQLAIFRLLVVLLLPLPLFLLIEDGAVVVQPVLALLLRLHLADHVGLEPLGQFQQFGDVVPVYLAVEVDELFMLQQVVAVLLEEGVEVVVLEDEAELVGQEVVAHEGHQQDQVVDHLLDARALHLQQHLCELDLEVLAQDVHHHELEERLPGLAVGGGGGPALRLLHAGVLLDDADVVQVERQRQQDHVGIWRVDAVRGGLVEQLDRLAVAQELHDLVLALARHAAVREHHVQLAPLAPHQLHDLGPELEAEREEELRARRDRVRLEDLLVLYADLLHQLVEEVDVLRARLEPPVPRLVDLGPRRHPVQRDVEELLGVDHPHQFEQVLEDALGDLVLGERLDLVLEEAAAFLSGGRVTLMHW